MKSFNKDLKECSKMFVEDADFYGHVVEGNPDPKVVSQLMIAKGIYRLVEVLEKISKDSMLNE